VQRFIFVPVKRTIRPTVNTKSPHDLPQGDVDALAVLRVALEGAFDQVHTSDTTAAFPSEQSRTDFLTGLDAKCDAYLRAMQLAVQKSPSFATGIFFFWEATSMAEKLNHAFDDVRFEYASIHFNVGAVLMNLAASVVAASPSGQLQASFDKEAYGYLVRAAGHFELAETIMADKERHPAGSATGQLTEDSKASFMTFLKLLALAQAQEIGMSKMLQQPEKRSKEINAALCHRAVVLYRECEDLASKKLMTRTTNMESIRHVVWAKMGVLDALSFSLLASTKVDADMPTALLLLNACQDKLRVVGGDGAKKNNTGGRPDLAKLSFGVPLYFESVAKFLEANQYRIQQINSLVTRAKASDAAVPALPPPQELARPRAVSLPFPLVMPSGGVAHPQPPPVAASDAESWVEVAPGGRTK
jgi:hypothetical protein